ncbi:MAG: BatA and WFA domain-containing protein [Victivallaceae bacterium]|nr:BatA and WFA domain-containing protein [Victivallaceae bacterium]
MTFLAPGYLWFLLLAIPLTTIYLLKIKPEQRFTPALFLWDKIVEEKQSSALFRKLRDWLSLLLILLTLIAVVMAMARPILLSSASKQNLLLVIDNSASMAARKHGISRIEQAKQLVANVIRNLNGSRQIILATVADKFSVVVNATANIRELNEGLEQIMASDMPLNSAALAFLANRQNFLTDSRAVLLSDGCFSNVKKLAGIELLKVGKPVENIGITAFDLVRLPGKKERLGIYFQLCSSYRKTVETDLIISHGTLDNIVKVCPVKLSPGINKAETYLIDNAPDGKWFAQLEFKDALAKDNIAPGYISKIKPVRIMVAGDREVPFFTMFVEAFSRGNNILALSDSTSAAVLASGNIPPESSSNKFIIFKPEGKSPFWNITSPTTQTGLSQTVMPKHPAMKFCQIDGLEFTGIKKISPPDGSIVLCRTLNNIPLIYKTSFAGQIAYIINFDPLESNFFLNINFPVMINAMIFDLTGSSSEYHAVYPTGGQLPLTGKQPPEKITFSSPGRPDTPQLLSSTETTMKRIGFYSCQTPRGSKTYATALLSQTDSLLNNSEFKSTAKPIESGIPLHNYLLIFALLIIVAESILYHQGKVA